MLLKVRVRADARKEIVEQVAPDVLKIAVREKALENAANRRVVELVALLYKVPKSRVRILRGHHSSSKLISVR